MQILPQILLLALTLGASGKAIENLPAPAAHPIDFTKEIKPLFEASCVKCHAKGKDKGGFSLETREAFLKGGETGPAVLPGKSSESYVVSLVAGTDPDEVMPKKGTKWTPEQVGLLRAWIDQGMSWDPAITFAKPPPRNLHPHAVALPDGPESNPVDRLLQPYLAAHGIPAIAPVEDRVFARRVWLDTIGLLPSPSQLAGFLADATPDKRAALVHRLLSDRRGYADNWLTFWNDLLRNDYKGTGFIDGGRKQISRWLYSALLSNLPYDQFVAQLVNPGKLSDGFTKGIIWRGAVNASMQPPMQAAQNISQVFMGVNLKCASCHDSFINDWALADAYGLAAIYSDQPLELVHCDKPTGQKATIRFLYPELGALDDKTDKPARLQRLAEILTSRENGRLGRTIVNRFWGRLLGRALVEPIDDMEQPAWDGDLLDWLAEDLAAHNFDLKHTLELILTSRAYQAPTVETPGANETYVFRGPLTRRLTAEQFSDALNTFSGTWERLPSSLEFDFGAEGLARAAKNPQWIWTDEPVELGRQREGARTARRQIDDAMKKLAEAQKQTEEAAARGGASLPQAGAAVERAVAALNAAQESLKTASEVTPPDAPGAPRVIADAERHRVIFRKKFTLTQQPRKAYAAILASQRFDVKINDKEAKPIMRDGARNGRIALIDLKELLVVGENIIAIDVSSHTEKQMNDTERKQHPASVNHVNAQSGLAFYVRWESAEAKEVDEIVTDETWRVRRNPDGAWSTAAFRDDQWARAHMLPAGVTPVDEGPALPPITRLDFANLPVELGSQLSPAVSIAANAGDIRASLLASDPLQAALDRPNREQIVPVRATAATTLQALELTNGATLDERLKTIATTVAPDAVKDAGQWIEKIYIQALSRAPSETERAIAQEMLGQPVRTEAVADFLWSLINLPEFQSID